MGLCVCACMRECSSLCAYVCNIFRRRWLTQKDLARQSDVSQIICIRFTQTHTHAHTNKHTQPTLGSHINVLTLRIQSYTRTTPDALQVLRLLLGVVYGHSKAVGASEGLSGLTRYAALWSPAFSRPNPNDLLPFVAALLAPPAGVFVFMCVCVYVCVRVCICVCVHVCLGVSMCICMSGVHHTYKLALS